MNGNSGTDGCQEHLEHEGVMIPELPVGKTLTLALIETWNGKSDEFGLRGIEIFNEKGLLVKADKIEVMGNLKQGTMDNFVKTCGTMVCEKSGNVIIKRDDQGKDDVKIKISFSEVETLAMIRLWNYNKCRCDVMIGVRLLELWLDKIKIFNGEISPSYDYHGNCGILNDNIWFTLSEQIFEDVRRHDISLKYYEANGRKGSGSNKIETRKVEFNEKEECFEEINSLASYRPTTSEGEKNTSSSSTALSSTSKSTNETIEKVTNVSGVMLENKEVDYIKAKILHIELASNWGLSDFIGLTGIQMIDINNKIIDSSSVSIQSSSGDNSTIDRLLNNNNLTVKRKEMYLIPFNGSSDIHTTITITFKEETKLMGLSFWNYNESLEMSYAGVKCIKLFVNGQIVGDNIVLRKAPGFVYFDYLQDVLFNKEHKVATKMLVRPNTKSASGFVYQLRLLSTWGDEYYIGLNGIECLDRNGRKIKLRPQNLACFPESVNILPNVNNDPRVSTNLIKDHPETARPNQMWLTPLLPNKTVRIFVIFDFPTYISEIRIYNYTKTPSRGVKDLLVSSDDLIVFSGEVPCSSDGKVGVLRFSLRDSM